MKIIVITIINLAILSSLHSQSTSPHVISTSGKTFTGSTIKLDWTLGELNIKTESNAIESITQGFHQPYYKITSSNELSENIGTIKVFPNPIIESINLELQFNKIEKVNITLYDFSGNLIWNTIKEGNKIQVNKSISQLSTGNYVLKIEQIKKQFVKTFKIQKIN